MIWIFDFKQIAISKTHMFFCLLNFFRSFGTAQAQEEDKKKKQTRAERYFLDPSLILLRLFICFACLVRLFLPPDAPSRPLRFAGLAW